MKRQMTVECCTALHKPNTKHKQLFTIMNWCDDDFSSQDRDMIYLDAAGKSPLPKIVAATGYEALQTKVIMILLTFI